LHALVVVTTRSTWVFLGSLLLLGACAFDGSTAFDPEVDPPPVDPAGDDQADPTPPGTPTEYVANAEETKKGERIAGSYQDSFVLDGVVEVIEAEVARKDEELEHSWAFGALPAGNYRLALVGLPYSPEPIDEFVLEYAVAGVRGHNGLLLMQASAAVTSFEGQFSLADGGDFEVRVTLPRHTKAIGPDDIPFRRIDVDYLVLTALD